MVFVSVFSPGCIYALDSSSGEICWRLELPGYGSSSTHLAGEMLLAKTSGTLYSLDPLSGRIFWEFCPYGPEREMIYSLPTVDGNRLFLGDRNGWLHCLNVLTGQTIWKRQISDGDDVNATACVVGGLVITATNAGFAQALSVEDGQPEWKSNLDGGCINHLFVSNKNLAVAANSLHFLDPSTGESRGRVQWPCYPISFAAGASSKVIAFRHLDWTDDMSDEEKQRYHSEHIKVALIDSSRTIQEIACSEYAHAARFSPATGLLYVSGFRGLDVLNPETSEWLYTMKTDEENYSLSLPDVSKGGVYVMDGYGVVHALRHPDYFL